jgi:hypothetical protein
MTCATAPNEAPAPAPAGMPKCPECGSIVPQPSRGRARTFCDNNDVCKQAHANRRAVRGKALVSLAMAWRVDRGSGGTAKAAFSQMCEMLDAWNAEDREANRPRADLYADMLLDMGNFRDRRTSHVQCTRRFQGCLKRSKRGGVDPSYARSHACAEGWSVEPGKETCPNCLDDPRVFTAYDVYQSNYSARHDLITYEYALRGGVPLGTVTSDPRATGLYFTLAGTTEKAGPFDSRDKARAALLAAYLAAR